ncbi:Alpha beta hydrolase fold protein [Penicillium mononematosum]|uniref:Alpha beta hydrolase fold protein n=1 Tax=Penicillium mononematosum TaxID=268346 RepID=UPI00254751AA|nr:Alpha beta hydrolase fold protein [Penicillium mononematosum]KAJ6178266.1 Alpha beta hydrolase fold protein [Penicillium mononematosum]
MDNYTRKVFTTSRSLTYTYYDSGSANPLSADQTTLLFLHGFPDSAHLWHQVVPHLRSLPHRKLVPDLLGFGGSSKPTDQALFRPSCIVSDLVELLAIEGVQEVVVIGHDWGSILAQRFWLWKPELCVGIAMLNVAYQPPTAQPFDLTAVNAEFERVTGYPLYAYWELFIADDGALLVDEHLDRFWEVMHGAREHWMRDIFCVRNAMRSFLEGNEKIELKEYAKSGKRWKEEWFKSVQGGGGLTSAMCSYKPMVYNLDFDAENALPAGRARVTVPAFFLGCSGDEQTVWSPARPHSQGY